MENFRSSVLPPSLPFIITSSTPEETQELGKRIAPLLEMGSVVALRGPLGAGKTCLIKGIARGLGIEEEITSPTYTIVSEYEIPNSEKYGRTITFYHIDAYRLEGNDDFSGLGGEEMVFGNGISVIEWSDRIPNFILPAAIRVDIEIQENSKRLIRIYRGEDPPL